MGAHKKIISRPNFLRTFFFSKNRKNSKGLIMIALSIFFTIFYDNNLKGNPRSVINRRT